MAATAVQVFNPLAIAGLGKALHTADMKAAGLLYNSLPNIRNQPALQEQHIVHVKALLEIIRLYNMGEVFGVHALHSHDSLPNGTVRLESDMGIMGFTWTKPAPVENLDIAGIHATFFKFGEDGVVPFEFAKGPSPLNMTTISGEFISKIGTYLVQHNLTDVIALQVGNFSKHDCGDTEPTAELEIQWGEDLHFTVVMPTSALKQGINNLIPTGWHVPAAEGPKPEPQPDPEQPPPGEHWNKLIRPRFTHKVQYDKGESVPLTPNALIKVLVEEDIINA